MPKQAAPVRRPELVQPHRTLDLEHGTPEQLFALRMALLHGANFNDPAPFDACAAFNDCGADGGGAE